MPEGIIRQPEGLKPQFAIPEISDELLEELNSSIEPVIRDEQGTLFYTGDLELDALRNTSFIWDPQLTVQADGLEPVATISTLHTYGYYGLFKPSVAEVLSQIPVGFVDKVCAYEVIGPKDAADLNKEQDALNAGYHVATIVLYERA